PDTIAARVGEQTGFAQTLSNTIPRAASAARFGVETWPLSPARLGYRLDASAPKSSARMKRMFGGRGGGGGEPPPPELSPPPLPLQPPSAAAAQSATTIRVVRYSAIRATASESGSSTGPRSGGLSSFLHGPGQMGPARGRDELERGLCDRGRRRGRFRRRHGVLRALA